MAYTRWVDSNWYSFYNASPESLLKEEQCLSLWHVSETKTFTYKELLSMGKGKLRAEYPEVSDEDIKEGLDIIARFKNDVLKDFAEDDLK